MTDIRLSGLTRTYDSTVALHPTDLEIRSGELFFLLGPSGCGKTTLLRLLAGLLEPTAGHIFFNGRDVTNVPTRERNAVMCFQGYALWPHLTVRDNVRFGLSVRAGSGARADLDKRVREVLQLTEIEALAERKPPELSGGQQQRVALARALAVKPACLLLDEPLSNLDARLRHRMRREIRRICRESGITTVYVTHDQTEALSTADRVAVMQGGRLVQAGSPREVYGKPVNPFVAEFMGATNLLEGTVTALGDPDVRIATTAGAIQAVRPVWPLAVGQQVTVSIRPELIRLATQGDRGNRLTGRLLEETFLGQTAEYVLAVGNGQLTLVAAPPMPRGTGEHVVEFDPGDVVVMAR